MYPESERIEVFSLQSRILPKTHRSVIGLLILLELKEALSVFLTVRVADPDQTTMETTKTVTRVANPVKQNVVDFLRIRFLGGDISLIENKLQRTEAETLEMAKYRQAKKKLQDNLYQIWKRRVEHVQSFQKKKAENEIKQSIFFRDNFHVRTALKEVQSVLQQSHNNRANFATAWLATINLFRGLKRMSNRVHENKTEFQGDKVKLRLILLFFSKLVNADILGKAGRVVLSKRAFVNGLNSLEGTHTLVARAGFQQVVGVLLQRLLTRLTLSKAMNKFATHCELTRFQNREFGVGVRPQIPDHAQQKQDPVWVGLQGEPLGRATGLHDPGNDVYGPHGTEAQISGPGGSSPASNESGDRRGHAQISGPENGRQILM